MVSLLAIPFRAAVKGSNIVLLKAETILNNYKQQLGIKRGTPCDYIHGIFFTLHNNSFKTVTLT